MGDQEEIAEGVADVSPFDAFQILSRFDAPGMLRRVAGGDVGPHLGQPLEGLAGFVRLDVLQEPLADVERPFNGNLLFFIKT